MNQKRKNAAYCLYISLWLAKEEEDIIRINYIKWHLEALDMDPNPEFDTDGVPYIKDEPIDVGEYFRYNDENQSELNHFWNCIGPKMFSTFNDPEVVRTAPNLLALKQLLHEEFRNSTTKEFPEFNSVVKKYEGKIKYGWEMGIDQMGDPWFKKVY